MLEDGYSEENEDVKRNEKEDDTKKDKRDLLLCVTSDSGFGGSDRSSCWGEGEHC